MPGGGILIEEGPEGWGMGGEFVIEGATAIAAALQ
jgi:hypothetical protein